MAKYRIAKLGTEYLVEKETYNISLSSTLGRAIYDYIPCFYSESLDKCNAYLDEIKNSISHSRKIVLREEEF